MVPGGGVVRGVDAADVVSGSPAIDDKGWLRGCRISVKPGRRQARVGSERRRRMFSDCQKGDYREAKEVGRSRCL